MFTSAICVLFLIKLRWPKKKSLYNGIDPLLLILLRAIFDAQLFANLGLIAQDLASI